MSTNPKGDLAAASDGSHGGTNDYQRVLDALGIDDDTDPCVVIDMLRSWEADAQDRCKLLSDHLRLVLEIARTWQPDYATKMDRDTLAHAAAAIGSAQ